MKPRPVTRPGLEYALGRIAAGEASGLVVAELHRTTVEIAHEHGWHPDGQGRRHLAPLKCESSGGLPPPFRRTHGVGRVSAWAPCRWDI